MDGRETTSRNILQKVGSAPSIRSRVPDLEESSDCDQELSAIPTVKANMNMKQEGPFLGTESCMSASTCCRLIFL